MADIETELHFLVPEPYHGWLAERANALGLPSPENYVLLLIRMAWQQHSLKLNSEINPE